MNIQENILNNFSRPGPRRGGISFNLIGLPAFTDYKKITLRNALRRLKKKQFIVFEADKMVITEKGRQYLKRRKARLQIFPNPFPKNSKKILIVMFDIPEERKAEREWFRRQLREFGYDMIQKSVWLGPSPLPKEFTDYVKAINLEGTVKTFKVSTINSSF